MKPADLERVAAPPQFVLASRSPRRVAFLAEAGYRFIVAPADVPEVPAAGEPPADYALRVARSKALALAGGLPVLGADTDVVLDGRILGKPADAAEAQTMLSALAGRSHQVVSAVVLAHADRVQSVVTVTDIDFAPLSAAEIAAYVASGEPFGKAGAYAIQGRAARFVRAIRGSYTGVVGLPLAETCALLATFDIHPANSV
jgi:septum formation protein